MMMVDETTTEQLAEIEGQGESTPATEYTPPEGWRVLQVGEVLRDGDLWVNHEGELWPTKRVGETVNDERYIRRIEPQPQPVPEPQPPMLQDADQMIRLLSEANHNHVAMIGRLQARINDLETIRDNQAATIEELRSEVSYVQNLLGESRQRVTQLEELVGSLRTINVTQEKAFTAAGKENTALRNQLAAVKAELASVAADRQRLRVELDAAQQVPADSPELRQLRADLAEVTRERDQYRDAFDRVIADLKTIRETTKAETVEAIVEWLVPVQAAIAAPDNVDESTRAGWFAEEVIQHLPSIMRSLTGLDSPEDVD